MNSLNEFKKRLVARLEESVERLDSEIKELGSTCCGREEYKENVRKIKVLKLRKGGAEKAITRWKADLI